MSLTYRMLNVVFIMPPRALPAQIRMSIVLLGSSMARLTRRKPEGSFSMNWKGLVKVVGLGIILLFCWDSVHEVEFT